MFTDFFMQETLIALIVIAAMALPAASQVHWIARALRLFSLLSGLVAVLYACNQQMTISRNLHWHDMWNWMNDSRPRLKRHQTGNNSEKESNSGEKHTQDPFHIPDFWAVLLISGPRILLHCSLRAYVTGLGVYQGFVWRDNLDTDTSRDDMRNIFIFFIVSLAVCYAIYWISDVANRCKGSPWRSDFDEVRTNPNVGVEKLSMRVKNKCQVSSEGYEEGCRRGNSLKGSGIRIWKVPLRYIRWSLTV
jgi:hypothetical protein